MSGTTPFVGYGMQLSVNGTQLAGLQQVQFGSDKVDTVDTTDTNATNGKKTFTPGLEDEGDCSVTCNFLPGDTSQQEMRTLKDAHAPVSFGFTQPTAVGGSRSFSGIITSIDVSLPLDKECKVTYKIKISGAVSYS